MEIRRKVKSCHLANMYVVGQYDKSESDKSGSSSITVFQTAHFFLLAGTRATFMPLSCMVAKRHHCNPVIVSLQICQCALALSLEDVLPGIHWNWPSSRRIVKASPGFTCTRITCREQKSTIRFYFMYVHTDTYTFHDHFTRLKIHPYQRWLVRQKKQNRTKPITLMQWQLKHTKCLITNYPVCLKYGTIGVILKTWKVDM